MDLIKKFLNQNWPIVTVLVLSLLITWPVFKSGYFSHHDDLQVMRIFEMRKCLNDLQIPCRWVPDMGYGNGYPLFNYYSALPYYLGAVLSCLTGFVTAAKLLFFIPLTFGGVSMYLLLKRIWGTPESLAGAILFVFAPFRALDSYVRGAVAESFAVSVIPLVFYFYLKLIKDNTLKNFLGASIALGVFLLCHNIMSLYFVPFLIVWVIYWSLVAKRFSLSVILSVFLGVGLASFFLIPAFLEKGLVQTETLTRFDLDFRVHFVTISQIFFNRSWGYGASVLGPGDTISFQVGWPHVWIALIAIAVSFYRRVFRKNNLASSIFIWALGIIFLGSIFLMHNKSAFIWENFPILQYSQFPWRLLSISIFCVSLLATYLISGIASKVKVSLVIVLSILTIFLNWSYFQPEKFYPQMTDHEKLSGTNWDNQQKAGIFDYLPKTAIEAREPSSGFPKLISGDAKIDKFELRSNRWNFNTTGLSNSTIEVPVYDFPNWTVYIDGQKVSHSHINHIGRIMFNVSSGDHEVVGVFENTLIRTIANMITLLSLIIVLTLCYKRTCKLHRWKN